MQSTTNFAIGFYCLFEFAICAAHSHTDFVLLKQMFWCVVVIVLQKRLTLFFNVYAFFL